MTFDPRQHGIRRLMTDEQRAFLKQEADSKGLSLNELIRRIFDEAVERLEHLARSRPKSDQNVTQKGPKVAKKGTETARLEHEIAAIYSKLLENFGEDEFEREFGDQFQRFRDACEAADLKILEEIAATKPWIKRRW